MSHSEIVGGSGTNHPSMGVFGTFPNYKESFRSMLKLLKKSFHISKMTPYARYNFRNMINMDMLIHIAQYLPKAYPKLAVCTLYSDNECVCIVYSQRLASD